MMKCLSAPSADDDDNRDEQVPSFADYNHDDNCKDSIEFSPLFLLTESRIFVAPLA